jgi:hypothetical protein
VFFRLRHGPNFGSTPAPDKRFAAEHRSRADEWARFGVVAQRTEIDASQGEIEKPPMRRACLLPRLVVAQVALFSVLTTSLVSLPCLAEPASAADRATAQSLFDSAMKLLEKKDFAAACPQLEESQRLDPGQGTQYRLATCYEGQGKTASAWASYLEVAEAAKVAKQPDRERVARERAKALVVKLPYLTIRSKDPAAQITRDGRPVPTGQLGVAVAVDPGKHEIVASAPGKAPFKKEIESVAGTPSTIEIPLLEAAPATSASPVGIAPAPASTAPEPPARAADPPPPASAVDGGLGTQRKLALVAGGVGVAAAVGTVIFGALAKSANDASAEHCGAGNLCDPEGLDDRDRALSRARISTVLGVVGGVGLAGGVALWVTAKPKTAATASSSPSLGQSSLRTNGTTLSFTRSF